MRISSTVVYTVMAAACCARPAVGVAEAGDEAAEGEDGVEAAEGEGAALPDECLGEEWSERVAACAGQCTQVWLDLAQAHVDAGTIDCAEGVLGMVGDVDEGSAVRLDVLRARVEMARGQWEAAASRLEALTVDGPGAPWTGWAAVLLVDAYAGMGSEIGTHGAVGRMGGWGPEGEWAGGGDDGMVRQVWVAMAARYVQFGWWDEGTALLEVIYERWCTQHVASLEAWLELWNLAKLRGEKKEMKRLVKKQKTLACGPAEVAEGDRAIVEEVAAKVD